MKPYKFILFDWDGCLGMTLEIALRAYKDTFLNHGIQVTDKQIAAIFGDWQGPSKYGVDDNNQFISEIVAHINTNMPKVKLYPDAINILKALRSSKKKLALLTSSKRATVQIALKNHQLSQYFDVFLGAEDVTKHKPDPEIINTALSLLNGKIEEAVMIGDSDKDILAAQNAGIDSILFFPPSHKLYYDLAELKASKPTHIIQSLEELKVIFQ